MVRDGVRGTLRGWRAIIITRVGDELFAPPPADIGPYQVGRRVIASERRMRHRFTPGEKGTTARRRLAARRHPPYR
jgi:hypothetical protein